MIYWAFMTSLAFVQPTEYSMVKNLLKKYQIALLPQKYTLMFSGVFFNKSRNQFRKMCYTVIAPFRSQQLADMALVSVLENHKLPLVPHERAHVAHICMSLCVFCLTYTLSSIVFRLVCRVLLVLLLYMSVFAALSPGCSTIYCGIGISSRKVSGLLHLPHQVSPGVSWLETYHFCWCFWNAIVRSCFFCSILSSGPLLFLSLFLMFNWKDWHRAVCGQCSL